MFVRNLVASSSRGLGQSTRRPVALSGRIRPISSSVFQRAQVTPGPPLSQTNRAEITLRRFWKAVHVQESSEGYQVTLDHRNLKTPAGTKLVIPKDKRILAMLIANEWENQDEVLKQHALPLTSLASRAIDGMTDETLRAGVLDQLMRYLQTDTILFPDESPRALVRMQKEHWDPLFSWLKEDLGVTLKLAEGFAPAAQDDTVIAKLKSQIEQLDPWQLAAFERSVYACKSFVIALALVKGRLTASQAADASHVEVRSQIEQWGEVEDSHDVDYQDIRRSLGSVACSMIRS